MGESRPSTSSSLSRDGWFSKRDTARIFGCGERYIDAHYRRVAPADAVRTVDRRVEFHIPSLVNALLADAKTTTPPPVDDPLLVGDDSPALERYRMARAQLAECDLAERQRSLVRSDVLTNALRPALTALRSAGDRLARDYGNDAAAIFNEGVGEFEAAALRRLNAGTRDDTNPDLGEGDPDAAVADDQ